MHAVTERPRGVAARSRVSAAGGSHELAGGVCHLAAWLGLAQSLLWSWEGEPFFSLLAQPRKASQSFPPLGERRRIKFEPCFLAGTTRKYQKSGPRAAPLASPAVTSNARPFPGRARMRRVLGWGTGRPGNRLPTPRPPLPSSRAVPAFPLGGALRPHFPPPPGTCPPCSIAGREENRGHAPRGTEFESSQATEAGA